MNFNLVFVAAFLAICSTARAAPPSLQSALQEQLHQQSVGRRHHFKKAKRASPVDAAKDVISKGKELMESVSLGPSTSTGLGHEPQWYVTTSAGPADGSKEALHQVEDARTHDQISSHATGESKTRLESMVKSLEDANQAAKKLEREHMELADLNHHLKHGAAPVKFNNVVKASAGIAVLSSLVGLVNLWFAWNNGAIPVKTFVQPPDAPAIVDPPASWVRDTDGNLIPGALLDAPGGSTPMTTAGHQQGAASHGVQKRDQEAVDQSTKQSHTENLTKKKRSVLFAREVDAEPHVGNVLQRRGLLMKKLFPGLLGLGIGVAVAPGIGKLLEDPKKKIESDQAHIREIQALEAQAKAYGIDTGEGPHSSPPSTYSPAADSTSTTGLLGGTSTTGLLGTSTQNGAGYGLGRGTGSLTYSGGLLGGQGVHLQARSATHTDGNDNDDGAAAGGGDRAASALQKRSAGAVEENAQRLEKRMFSFSRMRKTSVMALATLPLILLPVLRAHKEKEERKHNPTDAQKVDSLGGKYDNVYGAVGVPNGVPGGLANPYAGRGPAFPQSPVSPVVPAVAPAYHGALLSYKSPSIPVSPGILGQTVPGNPGTGTTTPLLKRNVGTSVAAKLSDAELIKAAQKKSNNVKLFGVGVLGTMMGLGAMLLSMPNNSEEERDDNREIKKKKMELVAKLKAAGVQPDVNYKEPPPNEVTSSPVAPSTIYGSTTRPTYSGGLLGAYGGSTHGSGSTYPPSTGSSTGLLGGQTVTNPASAPLMKRSADSACRHGDGSGDCVGDMGKRALSVSGLQWGAAMMTIGTILGAVAIAKKESKKAVPLTTPYYNAKGPVPGVGNPEAVVDNPATPHLPSTLPGFQPQGTAPPAPVTYRSGLLSELGSGSGTNLLHVTGSGSSGGLLSGSGGGGIGSGVSGSTGSLKKRDDATLDAVANSTPDENEPTHTHRLAKRMLGTFVRFVPSFGRLFAGGAGRGAVTRTGSTTVAEGLGKTGAGAATKVAGEAGGSTVVAGGTAVAKGGGGGNGMNTALTVAGLAPLAAPLLKTGGGRVATTAAGRTAVGGAAPKAATGSQPFTDKAATFSGGVPFNVYSGGKGLPGAGGISLGRSPTLTDPKNTLGTGIGGVGTGATVPLTPQQRLALQKQAQNKMNSVDMFGAAGGAGMAVAAVS